jgi:glucose/mannose transport system substrate-binding protein
MKKAVVIVLALAVCVVGVFGAGGKEAVGAKAASSGDGILEVWHWWAAGAERSAFDALLGGFKEKFPQIKVQDRFIPGSSQGIRQQLGMAFLGDKPPEVFVSSPGFQLRTFADAGRLTPFTNGWKKAKAEEILPKGLTKVYFFKNEAWGAPLNIHTLNTVWYNVKVFNELGLKEPANWAEFENICHVLRQNGIEPTAGTTSGWVIYCFYPFLIESLGADGFVGLGQGKISYKDERIRKAFANLKQYWVDNLMPNWSGYSWTDNIKPFKEGKVGMYFCMGDWVAPLFESAGMRPFEDYNYFLAPSTQKIIIGQVDGFAMCKGSDDPSLAENFMEYCLSVDAQTAFNHLKGSLAANLNVPRDIHPPIIQKTYDIMHKPDTIFLPNLLFLQPPDFYYDFRAAVAEYALEPTSEKLDKILDKLEGMRLERVSEGKWVDWQW